MNNSNLLRELFKEISIKNSPNYNTYYDIYYLTDTELKFSINDDRIGRFLTYSIRYENNNYNGYGFEGMQSNRTNIIRSERKYNIKNKEEFWKWFSQFYNDLH